MIVKTTITKFCPHSAPSSNTTFRKRREIKARHQEKKKEAIVLNKISEYSAKIDEKIKPAALSSRGPRRETAIGGVPIAAVVHRSAKEPLFAQRMAASRYLWGEQ